MRDSRGSGVQGRGEGGECRGGGVGTVGPFSQFFVGGKALLHCKHFFKLKIVCPLFGCKRFCISWGSVEGQFCLCFMGIFPGGSCK